MKSVLFFGLIGLIYIVNFRESHFYGKKKFSPKSLISKLEIQKPFPLDNNDFLFNLLETDNKIAYWKENAKGVIKLVKNKLEEAPIYYLLSIFCIEHRFKNSKLPINKFGEMVFGNDGDSKFIKDFAPSFLFEKIIKKSKKNYYPLVSKILTLFLFKIFNTIQIFLTTDQKLFKSKKC
jgi:hypothetical protein